MIKPQDFFGASPKTVLNKPFFHAQDQKAYNIDGGTSIADAWTTRDLNTVIHNDIQGASLSNNAVNLPAGTYYVEGSSEFIQYSTVSSYQGSRLAGIFADSTRMLTGNSKNIFSLTNLTAGVSAEVSGVIVLASPAVISLRYYEGTATATKGLGVSNNEGSITDASIPSIYADLKIWQLDRSLEIAPVAVNTGLQTVPSLDTTGNIMGFDISKTGANELTITKGSCLDSTLVTPLAFTADKTLAIPSVANTIYHIFAVLTTGGLYEARAYTSEAAVISDIEVDKFRWVGFWRTNGSSQCVQGILKGGAFAYLKPSEAVFVTGFASTTFALLDMTSVIPYARVDEIYVGCTYGSIDGLINFSIDGTNVATYTRSYTAQSDVHIPWGYSNYGFALRQIPFNGTLYANINVGSANFSVAQVKLRR